MNSKERVMAAINHIEPDHVPAYPLINSAAPKFCGISYEDFSRDADICANAILKTTDEVGVDILCTLVDLSVEAADWGQEIIYKPNDAAHPNMDNRLIKTADDYEKIDIVNPRETPRMSMMIEVAKKLKVAKGEEMPIVGFVFGPLGVLSMMRGQEKMFVDCIKNGDKMIAAIRNITETLKEYAVALLEAGCDAIMFDTLYASKTIMRPSMWDKYEGQFLPELCDTVRQHGGVVMLHNCGDGIFIKEQCERMGCALLSLQHLAPDCETSEDMKEKYGKDITICGHILPGMLLTATEDELRAECRKQIDCYKKGGGFILATGCEYPSGLNLDAAKIIVEEARTYGKY